MCNLVQSAGIRWQNCTFFRSRSRRKSSPRKFQDAGTPPQILPLRQPYAHLPQEVTESILPLFQVFRCKPQELQGHSMAQLSTDPSSLKPPTSTAATAQGFWAWDCRTTDLRQFQLQTAARLVKPNQTQVGVPGRLCRKPLSSQLGRHHRDGRKSLLQHLRWTQAEEPKMNSPFSALQRTSREGPPWITLAITCHKRISLEPRLPFPMGYRHRIMQQIRCSASWFATTSALGSSVPGTLKRCWKLVGFMLSPLGILATSCTNLQHLATTSRNHSAASAATCAWLSVLLLCDPNFKPRWSVVTRLQTVLRKRPE